MTPFGEYLSRLLEERDWSRRQFARTTGTSSSYIDFIVTGRRNPPKQRAVLERWSEVLGLTGPDRRRFFELADLSRAPETVRERIDQLEAENRSLKHQVDVLTDRLEKSR